MTLSNITKLGKYLRTEIFNDHIAVAAAAGRKPSGRYSMGRKNSRPSGGNLLLT